MSSFFSLDQFGHLLSSAPSVHNSSCLCQIIISAHNQLRIINLSCKKQKTKIIIQQLPFVSGGSAHPENNNFGLPGVCVWNITFSSHSRHPAFIRNYNLSLQFHTQIQYILWIIEFDICWTSRLHLTPKTIHLKIISLPRYMPHQHQNLETWDDYPNTRPAWVFNIWRV